jgi:hypothetical protein
MKAPRQPYMKWYPSDWRADPGVRMCSLAARGLWIELIGYMHEGEPYGYLTVSGVSPSIDDIAALVGRPLSEVRKAMTELEQRQIFSRDAGTIFSRRLVRDKAKADKDRENGKGGGNPHLTGEDKRGVNHPDKAQIPESRGSSQEERKDAARAALDPEADYFRRVKEICGASAGGLAKRLLAAKGTVPAARAAAEQASERENPREYIGAIIRSKEGTADDRTAGRSF